ncbi:hypothetical protein HPG69_002402 [Diceros bicornis minor]|uniref:Uncharacterized protein n=1 Tax=Diceros bicornis minor TaxID=77932 RepID=A0A7J7FNN1_DICBM|nr:hypothetical protein HPG69_002402 [Diceros bicornis minor]
MKMHKHFSETNAHDVGTAGGGWRPQGSWNGKPGRLLQQQPGLLESQLWSTPGLRLQSSGRQIKDKVCVPIIKPAIRDYSGHVSLDVKRPKEVPTAIRRAFIMTMLSIIPVQQDYCGNDDVDQPHTVTPRCGSVLMCLIAAP